MVKVGFVGLGHNGLAHVEAHLHPGKSRIVALCDRSPERLREAGQRFGIQRLYTDEGFFDDPEIEAVSIHTGDDDHCDPFTRAIKRGLHVLVEQPLANTEQDVLAMVEAHRRARAGLKVQVSTPTNPK